MENLLLDIIFVNTDELASTASWVSRTALHQAFVTFRFLPPGLGFFHVLNQCVKNCVKNCVKCATPIGTDVSMCCRLIDSAKMCKDVQRCAKMCKDVQRCAKMCKDVQRCAKMCKAQTRVKTASYSKLSQTSWCSKDHRNCLRISCKEVHRCANTTGFNAGKRAELTTSNLQMMPGSFGNSQGH